MIVVEDKTTDGFCEGNTDVGDFVGGILNNGERVGDTDGEGVEGTNVGRLVGEIVGTVVGARDGFTDGKLVG